MSMNLCAIADVRGGKPESLNRPVEILRPCGPAQRETFAKSWLIHLNDADAGALKIAYLLAQGKRNLPGHIPLRYVVANERPLQDCDGASEHSLHGPRRQRAGIAAPLNRH